MKFINKLNLRRSMELAAGKSFLVRHATAPKDMEFVTRETIKEGWHVGPYDYPSAFTFDPRGFFVGEVDGKVVCHVSAITYPNHHAYMGAYLVAEQHRGNGYGQKVDATAYDSLDKSYTIGVDVDLKFKPRFKARGFKTLWNTYVAMLSLDRTTEILAKNTPPCGIVTQPIHKINQAKLFEYDSIVFGTSRQTFIDTWINAPGTFGWVAINQATDNTIVGYSILRPVIRGGGTEIGLAMAPLFADYVHIAKMLLKTAAENCLANEALPKTKLELFHPVGNNCGENSSQLMRELEAELTHIAFRMYSKGIPIGRQMKKIYGIASLTFD